MRSSKSRSRNKSNRNRSVGNIVNRVFDSSGPEGKVRGTPQQIIDKYNQLARDAQLAGDRVATENFQQHAEHYLRMLGEAQKEQDQRREQQEQENRQRQADRDRERAQRQERESNGDDGDDNSGQQNNRDSGSDQEAQSKGGSGSADVIETGSDDKSGLVETPEAAEKPKPRKRAPRKKKADPAAEGGETPGDGNPDPSQAAAE